ncbi:MAG: TonB-dependent receptor [Maricaulis sp.]|jgi:Fe(3+) dicitrate transport protein|nr:TonB-dependent receptor [Maricaulis sp.]MDG2043299.1 TonB-dependent receptor [Maricaulis sp.]
MRSIFLAATALSTLSSATFANTNAAVATDSNSAPDIITVIGLNGDPDAIPGSADMLTAEDLSIHDYADVTRILRAVAGVNIQEEDGYGLRPNIGMRGTGVDRSDKITLMEDGVLISPAPYSAPAAYYFPHSGRMAGVEVIKGAAGVRYGPRTQGGSLNLLSTPVPEETAGFMSLWLGDENTQRGHAYFGGMTDIDDGVRFGGLLEGYFDSADGFKTIDGFEDQSTGYEIEDYVGKLRFEIDGDFADQSFELKLQYSDELSNVTYLGLTDSDFAADPFRRYSASQLDQMDAEHSEQSLRYQAVFNNDVVLSAVAYSTEFSRDWFKLDRIDPDGAGAGGASSISSILANPGGNAAAFEIIQGAAGFVSVDDAVLIKHNNRDYLAQGVQFELAGELDMAGASHMWRVGLRIHEDEMDRFQWREHFRMDNGTLVRTRNDVPGSESNRIDSAEAVAFFIQDEIVFDQWTFTPGLRFEQIDLMREDFGKLDTDRTGANLVVKTNSVDAFIPGFGIRYDVNSEISLFGGVHRGFAPPAPGSTTQDTEDATNWEFGARYAADFWHVEAIGFFNAYENLIGTCTNSTGGGCVIGDQFDGGEVDVSGVELTGNMDLGKMFDLPFSMPLRGAYTYTHAEFQTDFNSGFGPWGNVSTGDELPYIPEHQLFAAIGIDAGHFGGEIAVSWVDEVRTSAGQGALDPTTSVEGHTVTDASAWYAVTDNVRARVSVRNLTDEVYAVARRPAGVRPGSPRAVLFGLSVDF